MPQDRPRLRYTWEVTLALTTFSTLQSTFLLTPLSFPISFTLFPPDFMCKDQEGFHDRKDYILEWWGKSQCRYECLFISSPVKHHVTDPYLFICLFIYLNSADYDPNGGTRCQRTKSLSSMTRVGDSQSVRVLWAVNQSKAKHDLPSVFPGEWYNLRGW